MAEQELADRRIEREAVDTVAGAVDEHRRGTVHHVPRTDLVPAALQAILDLSALTRRDLAVNGEYGADGDVRIDVRGAVERIEEQHVVAGAELLRDGQEVLGLFGGHAGQVATVVERLEDHVVRPGIELLDVLAVHVPLIGAAQDVDEAGHVHLAGDHLGGEGQVVEDVAECTRRALVAALLGDDVAFDGDDRLTHSASSMRDRDGSSAAPGVAMTATALPDRRLASARRVFTCLVAAPARPRGRRPRTDCRGTRDGGAARRNAPGT